MDETEPQRPEWLPVEAEGDTVTLITGLEGAVDLAEPVTCRYCERDIVADDDHASDCCWRPGKAVR